MRLFNHLNEQYRFSREAEKHKNKIKKSLTKHFKEVQSKLNAEYFPLTLRRLCMVLSSIYIQEGFRFIDDGEEYIPSYKYTKGGDFYLNGDIEVFLRESAVNNMDKLFDKGKFFNEVVWIVSHNRVHSKRIGKMKNDFNFVGYNPMKKHIIDHLDYYAQEVAYQQQEEGFSVTKSLVHDLIGRLPVYKKFLDTINDYK